MAILDVDVHPPVGVIGLTSSLVTITLRDSR